MIKLSLQGEPLPQIALLERWILMVLFLVHPKDLVSPSCVQTSASQSRRSWKETMFLYPYRRAAVTQLINVMSVTHVILNLVARTILFDLFPRPTRRSIIHYAIMLTSVRSGYETTMDCLFRCLLRLHC